MYYKNKGIQVLKQIGLIISEKINEIQLLETFIVKWPI
jgi:hypothetical protein